MMEQKKYGQFKVGRLLSQDVRSNMFEKNVIERETAIHNCISSNSLAKSTEMKFVSAFSIWSNGESNVNQKSNPSIQNSTSEMNKTPNSGCRRKMLLIPKFSSLQNSIIFGSNILKLELFLQIFSCDLVQTVISNDKKLKLCCFPDLGASMLNRGALQIKRNHRIAR